MKYDMMIPPFEHVNFVDMKKKEAQRYFEWFTSQVDNRIVFLKKFITAEEVEAGNIFDYSANSLIPLWKWYEKKINIDIKDEEEYEKDKSMYPEWIKPYIKRTKIANETLQIGLDVSMYFAEIIIKNSNGKIKWGYFTSPKKRMSVNEPVLLGFKGGMDLNPRLIILNCTRKSSIELRNTRLFDMYNTWVDYIE